MFCFLIVSKNTQQPSHTCAFALRDFRSLSAAGLGTVSEMAFQCIFLLSGLLHKMWSFLASLNSSEMLRFQDRDQMFRATLRAAVGDWGTLLATSDPLVSGFFSPTSIFKLWGKKMLQDEPPPSLGLCFVISVYWFTGQNSCNPQNKSLPLDTHWRDLSTGDVEIVNFKTKTEVQLALQLSTSKANCRVRSLPWNLDHPEVDSWRLSWWSLSEDESSKVFTQEKVTRAKLQNNQNKEKVQKYLSKIIVWQCLVVVFFQIPVLR